MGTRIRRRTVTLAAMMAAALIAASCSTSTKHAAPRSETQRVERVRMAGAAVGYPSPYAISQLGNAQAMLSLAFDSLLWLDAQGEVIPWIASKWEASADGKEWRFTLRDGVKWQDGTPLTAEDVVFTYQYSATGPGKDGTLAYSSFAAKGVTDVRAEGPSVVVFRTADVNATFLKRVVVVNPIVPKHVWQSVSDPLRFRDPAALIGSGPYRIESFDEAQGSYLFVANDEHFRGAPYVRRIEFVPAPDEVLALRLGEIDVANLTNSTVTNEVLDAFDPARYGRVSANGQTDILLMIGMSRGYPYNEVRFRQALAYAMDRPDMVKRILLGRGTVSSMGMIEPADGPWVPKDLPTYPHDPVKARALLDEVGLKAGADGLRHLPSGEPFKPEMIMSTPGTSPLTAQVVQENLRDVGIEVTVKTMDRQTLNTAMTKANYDLSLMSYGVAWDPEIARDNLSKTATDTWWKVHGWDNPRFEELMALQLTQLDVAKRVATTHALERIVAAELPVVPLVTPNRMAMFDKTVMDSWYYTVGGGPVYPFLINRLIFMGGNKTGA